ncbi:peptide chain release factor aRF-1 [Candidatus Woesearchaeota archaeon]|nr:peptide chain release factor aRF-1 [Candidatus Woesearchaeota archaeon]
MSLDEHERYRIRHLLKELETYKGRHTELVSVYIPAGYEMSKIINHLLQEQGTATNIKSATTRKNVIDALEKMIQHLKTIDRTPKNGLAAFSGNVAEREGVSDVNVWSIEPPIPLNIRIYRCDKNFITEPLEDMCEVKEIYGLVVIDKRDGDVAMLKGKTIIPLTKAQSGVPGKHKTGGQSAQRMERLRDEAAKEFYKKIANMMKDQFLGNPNLKGIIVGGPGQSKIDFIDQGQITNELKQKIIAVKDLSYTGEFGLQELLEKSDDVLANEGVMAEKKIMQKFFENLATNQKQVSYGKSYVMKALEMGAVDVLLLSESLDDATIDEFEKIAVLYGTNVQIISVETREGVQLRDLGKVAAILRYAVEE